MEKYKINSVDDLTPELVNALIKRFKLKEVARLNKLFRYYKGEQDILKRSRAGDKPNNRINNPWARFISNTAMSYFIGNPISYQSANDQLMEVLQDIFDNNNEQSENMKLARDASVGGIAYELLYIDEEGNIKFDVLNANECFMVYDSTIKGNVLAGVRFYETYDYVTEESQMFVEVYTSDSIHYYKQDEDLLKLINEQPHYFKSVPMIPYYNNLEMLGDAEPVLTLIDAYDVLQSDSVNNLEEVANSYLFIKGVELTKEVAEAMKSNRMINVDGQDAQNADAKWLVRESEPAEVETLKVRTVDDMHRLSGVPDLSAQRFSGSESSGAALRYKIMNLENMASNKERYFKHSLERRLKLICNFLNVKGHSFDYNDVSMQFTRNLAADVEGLANIAKELKGIVSDKTLLSILPFIEDVEFELELLRQQNEGSLDDYGQVFDKNDENIE
ncbi:phage portal protein [Sporosarcina saromensis]|uniref:Phage portal protein n=1 Tax=Sporosarcina saromensis TaxID=359365 RepID=A0ABU4G776_9BACL|nr:phage portal protein [Sporosarcina saromensis]MDW0112165.1 phage portal protein [Sporosarcina saromensis]